MFGYIVVNKPELRIKEFCTYRSYYCGLCKSLQRRNGMRGQISLSYDMTFLAMLLSLLYEPLEEEFQGRCIAHPMEKQRVKSNEMIDYVADMNLLLVWYKCRDDFRDEHKIAKAIYGKSIQKRVRRIISCYERQEETIEENMKQLLLLEKAGECEIDELSACFGRILEEIFVVRQDIWEKNLRRLGFYIGKFIYILDAYDDLEKDRKKGCFNPFMKKEADPGFDEWVRQLLMMTAVEFAREFEKLPIVEDSEILRNILYSGVWTRYKEVRDRRMKKLEAENEESI